MGVLIICSSNWHCLLVNDFLGVSRSYSMTLNIYSGGDSYEDIFIQSLVLINIIIYYVNII